MKPKDSSIEDINKDDKTLARLIKQGLRGAGRRHKAKNENRGMT